MLPMMRFISDIASSAEALYCRGSMECRRSVLWLETQFGEEGQGARRPSLTPRLEGGAPEQPAMHTLRTRDAGDAEKTEPAIAGTLLSIQVCIISFIIIHETVFREDASFQNVFPDNAKVAVMAACCVREE